MPRGSFEQPFVFAEVDLLQSNGFSANVLFAIKYALPKAAQLLTLSPSVYLFREWKNVFLENFYKDTHQAFAHSFEKTRG